MFIIITWDDTSEPYVVKDYKSLNMESFNFKYHQEAQDFIYNSDNDYHLLSNTKIVELN